MNFYGKNKTREIKGLDKKLMGGGEDKLYRVNGWCYGVVRDYEMISYKFTLTFLRATNAWKPLKSACTMPYVGHSNYLDVK